MCQHNADIALNGFSESEGEKGSGSVFLCVFVSLCLPVYVQALPISLSICVSIYLSICLSVGLFVELSLCHFICLPVYPSIVYVPILSTYHHAFLGTLNNRSRIILGDPKRDPNFDNYPHGSMHAERSLRPKAKNHRDP